MPFISFTTNHKLTLRQENEIAKRTGELITILPGKKEENLMLHLEDNQIMYFRGDDIPCMMIAVKLYNTIDFDAKKKFTEELVKMIKETTNMKLMMFMFRLMNIQIGVNKEHCSSNGKKDENCINW